MLEFYDDLFLLSYIISDLETQESHWTFIVFTCFIKAQMS